MNRASTRETGQLQVGQGSLTSLISHAKRLISNSIQPFEVELTRMKDEEERFAKGFPSRRELVLLVHR